MKKTMWRIQAGSVLNGIVILTLAGLAGSVIDTIGSFSDNLDFINGLMNNSLDDYLKPDGWDLASMMMLFLEVFGYVLYFSGLKHFAGLLCNKDADSVLKVRTGAILTMVGVIAGHIPFIGWLVKIILVIIGFLKMLRGYKELKYSSTFAATKGAATLHSALVVQLIAVLIGLIPVIGGIVGGIMEFIAFIMILNGWQTIKNTTPNRPVAEIEVLPFGQVPGGRMIAWGVGLFLVMPLIGGLMDLYLSLGIQEIDNRTLYFSIRRFTWKFIPWIGLLICWLGIGQTARYQKSKIRHGIKLISYGLFLYLFERINTYLFWAFELFPENFNLNLFYACVNLLNTIAWVLCAIGFRHIGKMGHYGYVGKRGVAYLSAAAWIYAGSYFAYLPINLGLQELDSLVNPTGLIVHILCLVLMWSGWKYLLSAWYGKDKVGLSETSCQTNAEAKGTEPGLNAEDRKAYTIALAQKSEEELKALIRDERMYDETFISLARKELMNRMLGVTSVVETSEEATPQPQTPVAEAISMEAEEDAEELPRPHNTELLPILILIGVLAIEFLIFYITK